jgi:HSP20 family protein
MVTSAYTWDPFSELETMLTGMDRQVDRAWNTAGATPGINVYIDDETAVVTTELPGMTPADLKVQLSDDILTLGAERKAEEGSGEALVSERACVHFNRSISLPFAVDPDHVEARLNDGVLTIALKRAASDRPRSIQVNPS